MELRSRHLVNLDVDAPEQRLVHESANLVCGVRIDLAWSLEERHGGVDVIQDVRELAFDILELRRHDGSLLGNCGDAPLDGRAWDQPVRGQIQQVLLLRIQLLQVRTDLLVQ
ncbi:hypothetical protein [Microbacterium sp. Leaf203]|uniref:hypothetical protein n=1 Tax=Microbacterium sp. Leaf203 TaxID=1735677 RepID=UPI0006F3C7C0|nr:hypothetical protein [Microbacterium sp. Leaf203]KQM38529.1 hypothetical protein ASE56_14840 [Microbacterium sp. Leaf203]